MVRSKWSCVFPLGISDSIAFADRHPAIFASGNSRAAVRLLKPRNNTRRFRPMAGMCFIIVRKCAVKWVLLRHKFDRNIITPIGRIWIVKTSVAFCPLFVPRTCAIRDEIISTWLFADPKDCCYDICFPRKRLRPPRGGRFSDEDFIFLVDRLELEQRPDQTRRIERNKKAQVSSVSPLLSHRFPFKRCVQPRRLISRFAV